ncbi:hypothetical protein ID866_9001 [Astraeus odoratus]|nr:hypothetical protein ID866_9001 [Astraeus odoratus]
MTHHPSRESTLRVTFQTRAAQFFRKLAFRTRKRPGRKPTISTSSAASHVDDLPRSRSVDVPHKRTASSQIFGYRLDDTSNPTDTDDSSQDAPSSDNTPRQLRRHSTYDILSRYVSLHPRSAAKTPSFPGRQTISEATVAEYRAGAAPLSIPSTSPPDASMSSRSSDGSYSGIDHRGTAAPPQAPSQQDPSLAQEHSIDTSQTPRPSETTAFSGDHIVTTAPESLPSAAPPAKLISPSPDIEPPEQTLDSTDRSSDSVQGRRSVVPQLSTSLPPPFRVTERGARLSPSVATRQPLPILTLPPLPPPTPVASTSSRPRARLRSMPSLTIHGHSGADHEANHDTASLGGSDGDEDDEDDFELVDPLDPPESDEDEEDAPHAGPSTSRPLTSSSASDDGSSSAAGPSNAGSSSPATPMRPITADYFHSKAFAKSPQRLPQFPASPQPFSPKTPLSVVTHQLNGGAMAGPSRASPSSDLHSGLYRVASRSMIDLSTSSRRNHSRTPSNAPSISGATMRTVETAETNETERLIDRLLRRNSMPNYHIPRCDPPPYPSFERYQREPHEDVLVHTLVQQREDEERERLPPYSNSLYLAAVMPRKMEFVSPGIQAKDRKWRRVLCELEGTTFRVYKCPPGIGGTGVFGDWWERRVGAGDKAVPAGSSTHQPPSPGRRDETSDQTQAQKVGMDRPSTASSVRNRPASMMMQRSGSQSSRGTDLIAATSRAARRASGGSFLTSFRSTASAGRGSRSLSREPGAATPTHSDRPESRAGTLELVPVDAHDNHSEASSESHDANSGQAGAPVPVTATPPQPRPASRLSFLPTGRSQYRNSSTGTVEDLRPCKRDLIRAYTLQYAESGLGNDYLKRKNVIRVRLEGEQFLLQAPDIPSVVEWVEVSG